MSRLKRGRISDVREAGVDEERLWSLVGSLSKKKTLPVSNH